MVDASVQVCFHIPESQDLLLLFSSLQKTESLGPPVRENEEPIFAVCTIIYFFRDDRPDSILLLFFQGRTNDDLNDENTDIKNLFLGFPKTGVFLTF